MNHIIKLTAVVMAAFFIAASPPNLLSQSQMMEIIYKDKESHSLWMLIGGDGPEVMLNIDVKSWFISFVFDEDGVIGCRTHHTFDYRWSEGSCDGLVPFTQHHKVVVYDRDDHANVAFACESSHYVMAGPLSQQIKMLYKCQIHDVIDPS